MSGAMAAISMAQGGMQIANTYSEYEAERAKGRFEKTAFDINGKMKRIKADDALKRGDEAASDVRRDAAQVRGQQSAGYAGQGVDVTSGTPAAIQSESTAIGEMDATTVRNNAYKEAWGLRAEADQDELSGRMAKTASKFKRRLTLVTGGLQVLDTAGKFKQYSDAKAANPSRRTNAEDVSTLRRAYR